MKADSCIYCGKALPVWPARVYCTACKYAMEEVHTPDLYDEPSEYEYTPNYGYEW